MNDSMREWFPHGGKLCLSGAPVHIERDPRTGYYTVVATGVRETHLITLASAKHVGQRLADEIAEFSADDDPRCCPTCGGTGMVRPSDR